MKRDELGKDVDEPLDDPLGEAVDESIDMILADVIQFRHERHRAPELTWKEVDTAEAVKQRLEKIDGIQVKTGVGRLGVVGLIEGEDPEGPTVALRADMDGLPVVEETGLPYASKRQGVMHACGHDGHMANLYGSALVLSRLRKHLKGRVKLIFQPAEEGGAGADVMCRDGVLTDPNVDVIFGLHGWPELPAGEIYVIEGPAFAANAEVDILVRGRGGHAAMPHLGTDQILAAARVVEALQTISARQVAPTDPIALSIGQISGGATNNVIPPQVALKGTLRAMSRETLMFCAKRIEEIAMHAAATCGAETTVKVTPGYPAVDNHGLPTQFLESIGNKVLGETKVHRMKAPTMGSEDFAFFLQRIPGSYFLLGVDDGRPGGYPSLHHPAYDFNDKSLKAGMKMFVHAALASARFCASGATFS